MTDTNKALARRLREIAFELDTASAGGVAFDPVLDRTLAEADLSGPWLQNAINAAFPGETQQRRFALWIERGAFENQRDAARTVRDVMGLYWCAHQSRPAQFVSNAGDAAGVADRYFTEKGWLNYTDGVPKPEWVTAKWLREIVNRNTAEAMARAGGVFQARNIGTLYSAL